MVSVDNVNSLNSDSLYKFTFNLDGEYEKNSANVEATFTLNDTSVAGTQYSVSSKAVEKKVRMSLRFHYLILIFIKIKGLT